MHAKIGQLLVDLIFWRKPPVDDPRQDATDDRSELYHEPAGEAPINLALMRLIDAHFMETPWYGSQQMTRYLRRDGHGVHHNRIRRLMAMIGLVPIYQRRRTTIPHPEHQIYAYLLRDLTIHRPNQVW